MSVLNIYKLRKTDTLSIKFINEEMAELKSKPGLEDVQCYLAFDNLVIYMAKLDGIPIGCVAFNKYCSSYYSFGMYIVKGKYQRNGYGMQLFNAAMNEVDWSQIVSAYSVPHMVNKYARYGFESRWLCKGYELNMSEGLDILKGIPFNQGLIVKDIDEVSEEALLSYDTSVFGYQRRNFILKWLHAKGSHAKVVDTREGSIVGYAAARLLFVNEDGYRVGPLFADSIEAAQVLLKALFEDITCHGVSSSKSVIIQCPSGKNEKSEKLMELLKGRIYTEFVYMTTRGIPKGLFDNWFAITSSQLG